MIRAGKAAVGAWTVAGQVAALTLVPGCHGPRRPEPVSIANVALGPMVVAVAPAINASGSADFDPQRLADVMASELSYAERIRVIPVSRVLAVLRSQKRSLLESSSHAAELARLVGADAILVFAVTEYDPFDPPIIGISAQVYAARSGSSDGAADSDEPSESASLGGGSASPAAPELLASYQRVFDASHASVAARIREFARHRAGDGSPYGWRKFVVSQREFMRFCCHETIRALLRAAGRNRPERT